MLTSFNAPIWALLLNAFVLTCFVLLVLWSVLRPGRSAATEASWDASQGLSSLQQLLGG